MKIEEEKLRAVAEFIVLTVPIVFIVAVIVYELYLLHSIDETLRQIALRIR